MDRYTKQQIQAINEEFSGEYYLPDAVFAPHHYHCISIEVKLAYGAMLNVLLKAPLYTKSGDAYLKADNPEIINILKKLANKEVATEKMQGYFKELDSLDFIDVVKQNIFVKKVD